MRFLRALHESQSAGSTVEWLLVSGASLILFSTLALLINTMISFIFTRTAVVICTPFG